MTFTLIFSALLVLVQLLEGTDPRYSGLVFCFFMLSTFAFNVAGGFTRPSGAYIISTSFSRSAFSSVPWGPFRTAGGDAVQMR